MPCASGRNVRFRTRSDFILLKKHLCSLLLKNKQQLICRFCSTDCGLRDVLRSQSRQCERPTNSSSTSRTQIRHSYARSVSGENAPNIIFPHLEFSKTILSCGIRSQVLKVREILNRSERSFVRKAFQASVDRIFHSANFQEL